MSPGKVPSFPVTKEPTEEHDTPTSSYAGCNFEYLLKISTILVLLALTMIYYRWGNELEFTIMVSFAPPLGIPEHIQRQWGQYSPWFPIKKYKSPPKGCEITQVNIVRS